MNKTDVLEIIQTIANQLGVAVDYVVPALAKYNIANCLVKLAHAMIEFVIAGVGYIACSKMAPRAWKDFNNDTCLTSILFVAVAIVGFMTVANGMSNLFDGIIFESRF